MEKPGSVRHTSASCGEAGGIYVTSAEVAAEEGRQVRGYDPIKVAVRNRKASVMARSGQAKVGSNSWELSWEGLLDTATKPDIQCWLYMGWLVIPRQLCSCPNVFQESKTVHVT